MHLISCEGGERSEERRSGRGSAGSAAAVVLSPHPAATRHLLPSAARERPLSSRRRRCRSASLRCAALLAAALAHVQPANTPTHHTPHTHALHIHTRTHNTCTVLCVCVWV